MAGVTPQGTPFYELVLVSGKGLGLFAAQNIPRGTRILEESPLVHLKSKDSEQKLTRLVDQLTHLSPEQANAFDDLYHDPRRYNKRLLARFRKHALDALGKVTNRYLAESMMEIETAQTVKRIAIFHTNCVRLGETGEYGTGLFPLFSRLNHSCNANVYHSYNPTIGKETVHAVRQINKGEELVTSYIHTAWRTKEQRDDHLQEGWDFSCKCKACEGRKAAKSEERRERMFEIDQALALYEKGLRWVPGLSGFKIPLSVQQALVLAEEMLDLLREEGIVDLQLAQV